jgi:hypothetical protein
VSRAQDPFERLRRAERDLATCRVELDRARARGDDHEARTCAAAIALLERQIAILRSEQHSD